MHIKSTQMGLTCVSGQDDIGNRDTLADKPVTAQSARAGRGSTNSEIGEVIVMLPPAAAMILAQHPLKRGRCHAEM
jgi:hypothetical protein